MQKETAKRTAQAQHGADTEPKLAPELQQVLKRHTATMLPKKKDTKDTGTEGQKEQKIQCAAAAKMPLEFANDIALLLSLLLLLLL